MQLRYLKKITLKKANKTKQPNGTYINTYTDIKEYNVRIEEITDEPSITIYGTEVNKMYRITSPMRKLEDYLKPKITDSSDNISKYFIDYNNSLYKISAVKNNWVDIEYNEGHI